MKAFLLAAGRGTRLKPYTDRNPKCLIPIHGTPLLRIWIDLLAAHGVSDVLINTHHHWEQVEEFVSRTRPATPLALHTVYEPELLGSAGTIWNNRAFVAGAEEFIIAYADNLTNIDLTKMATAHHRCRSGQNLLTMGLMRAPNPKACGIVTLDDANTIVKFIEKPEQPESDLANAGIYIASDGIYEIMDGTGGARGKIYDFGHHVLPSLVGRMQGYEIEPDYLMDIGTPEAYERALDQWPTDSPNN